MTGASASSTTTSATCSGRRTTRCTRSSTRTCARRGLSSIEWRVLATLHDGEPLTVSQLAHEVLSKQPTVTKLVQRMADQGWVALRADAADQRRTLVSATAAGRRLVKPLVQRRARTRRAMLRRAGGVREGGAARSCSPRSRGTLSRSRRAQANIACMVERKQHLDRPRRLAAAGLLPVLGLPADPDQDDRRRGAAAVAGLAPLRRRDGAAVAWCAVRRVTLFERDGTPAARACWPACCSPANSAASIWACATRRPRG